MEDLVMIITLSKSEFALLSLIIEQDIKGKITEILKPLEGRHFFKLDTTESVQKIKDFMVEYHTDYLANLRPLATQGDNLQMLVPKSHLRNWREACRRVPALEDPKYHMLYINNYSKLVRNLQDMIDYEDKPVKITQLSPKEKV